MYEKVNPNHPDKVADRIAGALVDYAYSQVIDPKIAAEVLIGHGECNIIAETSVDIPMNVIKYIVTRIVNVPLKINYKQVPQDSYLADNQRNGVRCGDNGIFKGMPITQEQRELFNIADDIYRKYKTDGKYVLDLAHSKLVICQSCAENDDIRMLYDAIINPLGEWTGGIDVDTGATNRKLGSDMGDAVTGGGLHGKDLSKADVSVNIYAHLKAQEIGKPVELCCAIGDDTIDGKPYSEIVDVARKYINTIGGFEALAEWGLIRS